MGWWCSKREGLSGSRVNEGDLLAEIDTPEVDAQLVQARTDLATAPPDVKLALCTTSSNSRWCAQMGDSTLALRRFP